MADFQTVANVEEIPLGEGRSYHVNGRIVGVFHVEDGFFAIDDICPHMGASLASGYLEGDVVSCPWHAWRFCVRDGTWCDNPNSKVKTRSYETRILENSVQVLVPDPPPRVPPPESSAS